jgi:hypothetical protein
MSTPPRTTPEMITELASGEVLVVGTNAHGQHGAGAAAFAHERFGLRWGVGEGLCGSAYALPTMEGPVSLAYAAQRFLVYARLSHDLVFLLTKVGCGIAGYDELEVRQLFANAPANVVRPAGW